MDKKYIVGGSFAVAFLAIIVSGPKVAENLRPLKNDRMQEGYGVYTDKDTGKIYGFIQGAGGEQRFVQYDKTSESKVRKERIDEEKKAAKEAAKIARQLAEAAGDYIAPSPVAVSKSKLDVRSGEIFSKDGEFEEFLVNSRVKWRTRERKMLYRLSITAPNNIVEGYDPENSDSPKEPNCISKDRESALVSLVTGKDNQVRLRFKDSDDFWLRDFLIPLSQKKAQNFQTTAIDAFYKDECGSTNQFVFHGRLDNFSPPDYTWVEDGKLLFSGVEITRPETPELD